MEYRKHVFTNHEKKLFLDIVRKYKKIVENRQTDGSTIKGKHAAWDQITCEYNASTMTVAQASSKQLRRLWTNMRQRQREAMVRARQNGTVVRLPSTDKDLAVSDITILNTAPNSDSQEIIKQEFGDTAKPSSASLQIPLSVSPPLSTVPPPLITLAAPLPCPSLTHLPQPHLTQIHRLSYGREKLEAEPKRETLEEREYEYKKHHANKVHELEMEVLKEKLREAKAKAELAEFYLKLAKKGIFPGDPRKFYLRLTRLNEVVCVKYSLDNAAWTLLRLCPFRGSFAGLMACTPQRGGLGVTFSGLKCTSPAEDILHSN